MNCQMHSERKAVAVRKSHIKGQTSTPMCEECTRINDQWGTKPTIKLEETTVDGETDE